MNAMPTPLERHGFTHYSRSVEISEYLHALAAAAHAWARIETLGYSINRHPIDALLIAAREAHPANPKLRVMMVGSQHGASEAAGCEAMLYVAREILFGKLQAMLNDLEFILIPNANPDGRELDSSRNAHDININRDFVLLSQPESSALDHAVLRYRPQVILDAHESASFKRKTLGRTGYMTNFEAQFDVANTPAIPHRRRDYLLQALLPELLAAVARQGLPAQRYIREITSATQPITHGGLTIRKFRNKAGVRGALTVLLETPMEPKSGRYPTYRNIGVRVEKQFLCQSVFIDCVYRQRAGIHALMKDDVWPAPGQCIPLNARYEQPAADAAITIDLRHRESGELHPMVFADHRALSVTDSISLPTAYVVTAHTAMVAMLLARHQLEFETIDDGRTEEVTGNVFAPDAENDSGWKLRDKIRSKAECPKGALLIPTAQQHGALLPLLLDPRSHSSVFQYPTAARLIKSQAPFFICEVNSPIT